MTDSDVPERGGSRRRSVAKSTQRSNAATTHPKSSSTGIGTRTAAGVLRRAFAPQLVSTKRKRSALAVAAIADMLQLGFFEGFALGAFFPPDIVLDLLVVGALIALLGFRFRLLVALALELTPGATLFPSWTAFVLSLQSADLPKHPERSSGFPPRSGASYGAESTAHASAR